MPGLLWLIVGVIVGGCFGFLTALVVVAAGTDAARYHDDSWLS